MNFFKILSAIVLSSLLSVVPAFTPIQLRSAVEHHHDFKKSAGALSMFTGIVEEIGTVVNLEQRDDMILWDGSKGQGTELTVRGEVVMDGAYLG